MTALAEAGAAALVTAMATDLWQDTRTAAIALFRRSDRTRGAAIEAQLDGNEALVREADTPDTARRALLDYWTLELAALLRRHPAAHAPLTHLTATVTASLPEAQRPLTLHQTNTAHDSATIYAVQHGTLPIHHHPEAGDM
ncbi:hypothetical protein [Streptomyces sp. G-G2]|uniref:hypothetical protein n=1 Tax=Streptomyces sp. G-G2 TaxID=3046201 RepID=UPI0024BB92BD|nr:hypothetical protein [Streptomyces sp. G-G2]MDJ0379337.1 hypothetical protein [Streptomyces sp. G-G2]